ncbi:MAG: hypothetical protein PF542_03440 [Nanoarchaeota archaeon]|nr:hypothetical protein [Nanoarchaeota archaeon]
MKKLGMMHILKLFHVLSYFEKYGVSKDGIYECTYNRIFHSNRLKEN